MRRSTDVHLVLDGSLRLIFVACSLLSGPPLLFLSGLLFLCYRKLFCERGKFGFHLPQIAYHRQRSLDSVSHIPLHLCEANLAIIILPLAFLQAKIGGSD